MAETYDPMSGLPMGPANDENPGIDQTTAGTTLRSQAELDQSLKTFESLLSKFKSAQDRVISGIDEVRNIGQGSVDQAMFKAKVLGPYQDAMDYRMAMIHEYNWLSQSRIVGRERASVDLLKNRLNTELTALHDALNGTQKNEFTQLQNKVESARSDMSSWNPFGGNHLITEGETAAKVPRGILDDVASPTAITQSGAGTQPGTRTQPEVHATVFDTSKGKAFATRQGFERWSHRQDETVTRMDSLLARHTPGRDHAEQMALYYAAMGAKVGERRAYRWAANIFGTGAADTANNVIAGRATVNDLTNKQERQAFNFLTGAEGSRGLNARQSAQRARDLLSDTNKGLAVPGADGKSQIVVSSLSDAATNALAASITRGAPRMGP